MKLILPMAGDGRRFKGYAKVPKYMVDIAGSPMLCWGLKGTEFAPEEIIAVVRSEHCEEFGVEQKIREWLGETVTIVKVGRTRGASETVLLGLAQAGVDLSEMICVKDCDCLSVPARGWRRRLEEEAAESGGEPMTWVGICEDGLAPYATTTNKSHLRVDIAGNILEIREKVRLSPWFVAGYYIFSSASVFQQAAQTLLNNPSQGECFLSRVVAHILKNGGRGQTLPIQEYQDLGTPEALQTFLKCQR